jgi:gamma-glutamylcyclotransferase (GGCT)/AIG2-like uncharacterized protein YtfP
MSNQPRPSSAVTPDDYIFVYGTLRSAPRHQMNKVLEREGDRVGRGRVPGILYNVGPYPGAVRKAGTRAFILGDVYRLRDSDRALKVLDRYEGWNEKKPESSEFRRSRVAVDMGAGKRIHAWIYLYNQPTIGLPRITSGDYLKLPRDAASSSRSASKSGSRAR